MKYLLSLLLLTANLCLASEPQQEWESLDLEEENLQEMEEQRRQEFEDREGDLQIQAEEEEILPLESEDSRDLRRGDDPKED